MRISGHAANSPSGTFDWGLLTVIYGAKSVRCVAAKLRVAVAAGLLTAGAIASPAWAGTLSDSASVSERTTELGTCRVVVNHHVDGVWRAASIELYSDGSPGSIATAGGAGYETVSEVTTTYPDSPVAEQALADCLGVEADDVSIVSQNGAEAGDNSYFVDEGMNLDFVVLVPAGGRQAGSYSFNLSGTDTVPDPYDTPVADAGQDQEVESGTEVTLDGGGTGGQDKLSFLWVQTAGETVTLSSGTAQKPTFTAPTLAPGAQDAVLTFSLVVDDGLVDSEADEVTITVKAPAGAQGALSQSGNVVRSTMIGDYCMIGLEHVIDDDGVRALLVLIHRSDVYHAGGAYYDKYSTFSGMETVTYTGSPVTKDILATCFGIDASEVTITSQNGAETGGRNAYLADEGMNLDFFVSVPAVGRKSGFYSFNLPGTDSMPA